MASHTRFRQYFSKNKCDNISHYPMNLFRFLITSHFFHTTIKMPILQTIQLTLQINPYWSIRGKFDQEIEILPSKCGK